MSSERSEERATPSREGLEAMVWGVAAGRLAIDELMAAIDSYAKGEGWLLADSQERAEFIKGGTKVGPKRPRDMAGWTQEMRALVEELGVKGCSKCVEVKKVEAFGRAKGASAGLRSQCLKCEREAKRGEKQWKAWRMSSNGLRGVELTEGQLYGEQRPRENVGGGVPQDFEGVSGVGGDAHEECCQGCMADKAEGYFDCEPYCCCWGMKEAKAGPWQDWAEKG